MKTLLKRWLRLWFILLLASNERARFIDQTTRFNLSHSSFSPGEMKQLQLSHTFTFLDLLLKKIGSWLIISKVGALGLENLIFEVKFELTFDFLIRSSTIFKLQDPLTI